jgi:protein-S-isoprenylcysteine O-methyltransferase Ste14
MFRRLSMRRPFPPNKPLAALALLGACGWTFLAVAAAFAEYWWRAFIFAFAASGMLLMAWGHSRGGGTEPGTAPDPGQK